MYVGVTGYTTATVRDRIRAMARLELNEVVQAKAPPVMDAVNELWLRLKLWSPPEQLLAPGILGHPLLSVERALPVQFIYREEVDGKEVFIHTMIANVSHLPRHRMVDAAGAVAGTYGYRATVEVEPSDHPFFAESIEAARTTLEIRNRWHKVETQVMEFLRRCKSVNHALEVWPDVRRYLDEDIVERVNKKLGPREKNTVDPAAEKLKEMDLDTITASAVIARMAEADTKR